ncbi:MAG: hypothetical protein AAF821_08380 [Cyanobacteria bacterium P01_D01_bin.156]
MASGLGVTLLPESSKLAQTGIFYRSVHEVQLAIAWNRTSPIIESFLKVVEACHGTKLTVE